VSYLRSYNDAGRVLVRLTRPTEDSEGGFSLSCLEAKVHVKEAQRAAASAAKRAALGLHQIAAEKSRRYDGSVKDDGSGGSAGSGVGVGAVESGGGSGRSGGSGETRWYSGPPEGFEGCAFVLDAWRPAVHASEISHATLDFRAGPHEAAAGLAVVTFEPLLLTPWELASRNGRKFKLTEIAPAEHGVLTCFMITLVSKVAPFTYYMC